MLLFKHLKVFGFKTFVYIPRDKVSKLDDKLRPCIFQGYGVEEFSYRLWDSEVKKVNRNRDVIFCKDQIIKFFGKIDNLQDYMKDLVNLGPNAHPIIHDREMCKKNNMKCLVKILTWKKMLSKRKNNPKNYLKCIH